MAKVTISKEMEEAGVVVAALRALKKGKATPEQQKIAYEHHVSTTHQPKKKIPPLVRNVLIARYIELVTQDEEEHISDAQACREVAEDLGVNLDTVEREYRKFKNQSEEEKTADYRNFYRLIAPVLAASFSKPTTGKYR